jgi:hypothetical protein
VTREPLAKAPVASSTPSKGRSSRRGHAHRPLRQQLATADAGFSLAVDVGRTPSPCTRENRLSAFSAADDWKLDFSGRSYDHPPLLQNKRRVSHRLM